MSKHFLISGFADEIDANFDVQMANLKKLGMQYIEIRGVDGKNIAALTDEEIILVKEKMDSFSVRVSSIGSPVGKDEVHEDFGLQLQRFVRIVTIAKMLDSKYIRIFSYFAKTDLQREEMKEEVVKRLIAFVEMAERENLILLHENEKEIFGESHKYCKYLFDRIPSPHFKAVFDPANFVQAGIDPLLAFEYLKEHIVYLHIKDALPDGKVVPAGQGTGKIKEILMQLKASGFQGFLSLEPHLGSFTGLSALEANPQMTEKSGPEKFALAYSALTGILQNMP